MSRCASQGRTVIVEIADDDDFSRFFPDYSSSQEYKRLRQGYALRAKAGDIIPEDALSEDNDANRIDCPHNQINTEDMAGSGLSAMTESKLASFLTNSDPEGASYIPPDLYRDRIPIHETPEEIQYRMAAASRVTTSHGARDPRRTASLSHPRNQYRIN